LGNADNASSDLHPVAEILDNLKNDDLALRLGALKRLTTIALALGPDRTTNDLVPFLGALAADEEDEVLLVLGEELPKLVGFGQDGVKSAHVLLPVLETLLQAEETVVRQQAVVATQRVMEALETAVQVEEHLWPLWIRLAQGSFFISKASAATLAADVYARLSTGSMRQELRRLFATQVCLDECPIVRRAAAPTLARLVLLDGKNGERMETDADGATSTARA
jgi:serine/threonine-protein phosphatase 2A regulatory subunit A